MKQLKAHAFIILLLTALIIPSVALAAWWNPFSWHIWSIIFNRQNAQQNNQQENILNQNKYIVINSISPSSAAVGDKITIGGKNFLGDDYVSFYDSSSTYVGGAKLYTSLNSRFDFYDIATITVPTFLPPGSYTIKVSYTQAPGGNAIMKPQSSNGFPFVVLPSASSPALYGLPVIISPVQGEKLTLGSSHAIKWVYEKKDKKYNIFLRYDNGTFVNIASNIQGNQYTWKVGDIFSPQKRMVSTGNYSIFLMENNGSGTTNDMYFDIIP